MGEAHLEKQAAFRSTYMGKTAAMLLSGCVWCCPITSFPGQTFHPVFPFAAVTPSSAVITGLGSWLVGSLLY